jgi:hypothetical protein
MAENVDGEFVFAAEFDDGYEFNDTMTFAYQAVAKRGEQR